jgi:hypothetical protein
MIQSCSKVAVAMLPKWQVDVAHAWLHLTLATRAVLGPFLLACASCLRQESAA